MDLQVPNISLDAGEALPVSNSTTLIVLSPGGALEQLHGMTECTGSIFMESKSESSFQPCDLQQLHAPREVEGCSFEDEEPKLARLHMFDGFDDRSFEDEEASLQPLELQRFRTFDEFNDSNVEDAKYASNVYSSSTLLRNTLLEHATACPHSIDTVRGSDSESSSLNASTTSAVARLGALTGEQSLTAAKAFSKRDILLCISDTGVACVEWMVDAKRILSTDRQIVSSVFEVGGDASKPLRLKFILHARGSRTGQRNASLRNARGRGSVSVKNDEANDEFGSMMYRISVGNSCSEWLPHDFMKTSLLRCEREWDFHEAVDKTTKQAKVRLDITGIGDVQHTVGELSSV